MLSLGVEEALAGFSEGENWKLLHGAVLCSPLSIIGVSGNLRQNHFLIVFYRVKVSAQQINS
jgi:hypothetical protein